MPTNSRRVGAMIALVAGGVVAGGVLASSVAANAEGKAPSYGYGYGDRGPGGPGGPGGHGGPGRGTPLTGDALAKVKAAIEKQYPGATVDAARAEGDGYEAAVTKKDGSRVHVRLDKAFAITGEEATRGPRGPQGAPLSSADLAKVKAAIESTYPGATVDGAYAEDDGYDALITKKDGAHARIELNKAFAVTGEDTRRPGGPGGQRPDQVTGDALAKVTAAIEKQYPGATVELATQDRDGSGYDAFITKKDGSKVRVELDKAFTVTGEDTARPGGRGGFGGHGNAAPAPEPPATS
ncbi:MAG: hypothetical protein JWO22_4238 [Frankiales bacterium]|nr:hypothetical protein [Frankiales bacterium]